MRLIDLDDDAHVFCGEDGEYQKWNIDTSKTVDAEPVRYGRWKKAEPHGVLVYSDAYRQCSECKDVIYLAFKMNYCPNCGSRMVGGEW